MQYSCQGGYWALREVQRCVDGLYEKDFVNGLDGLGEEYRNLREIREGERKE